MNRVESSTSVSGQVVSACSAITTGAQVSSHSATVLPPQSPSRSRRPDEARARSAAR